MRTLIHMAVGAVAGFALGIVAPIAMYNAVGLARPAGDEAGWRHSVCHHDHRHCAGGRNCRHGLGLSRGQPAGRDHQTWAGSTAGEFEDQFRDYSLEEQREALAMILPRWFSQYRKSMTFRVAAIVILVVVLLTGMWSRPTMLLAISGVIVVRTARLVMAMRDGLQTIRNRWGDDFLDQFSPLPSHCGRMQRSEAGGAQQRIDACRARPRADFTKVGASRALARQAGRGRPKQTNWSIRRCRPRRPAPSQHPARTFQMCENAL